MAKQTTETWTSTVRDDTKKMELRWNDAVPATDDKQRWVLDAGWNKVKVKVNWTSSGRQSLHGQNTTHSLVLQPL